MKISVKITTLIIIAYSTCFGQKTPNYTGTYISIKPDTLSIFTIKENSDHSLFGILKLKDNNGYVSLLKKGKLLSGIVFLQDGYTKNIEIFFNKDTLYLHNLGDSLSLKFVFLKIKIDINSTLNGSLDSRLYGKWVDIDKRTNKLVSSQYRIFHPNGDLELVHPKINVTLSTDAFRSGTIKIKWATEGTQWYIIYDSKLPLSLKNIHMGSFRLAGDTLYTTTPKGNVSKSLRDKRF